MGFSIYPVTASTISTSTGWTAGVAGTFLLSNTLTAGTYIINTDSTQTMTITLVDSAGHGYAGTVRGGSGFITTATDTNQIKIPGSLTYPFGITINPIAVPQLAAPTSVSLSFAIPGSITGTWGTVPAGATGAVLFTTTGDVLNFSSTASGATLDTITSTNTVPGTTNEFVVAFKNSSGAIGLGTTFSLAMPASYDLLVDYLVVAGGGGGSGFGGSGAGGFRTGTSFILPASFTVTVGAGGTAASYNTGSQTIAPTNGINSVFSSITSTGGGATLSGAGVTGGSGSGAQATSNNSTVYGAAGISGQGNAGGYALSSSGSNQSTGGGGGGAGGNGANGGTTTPGAGGGGSSSIIATGSSVTYAGGGGGASIGQQGAFYASGGSGGGGTGASTVGSGSGTVNTGGGAGAGGNSNGSKGAGGSGIVIIAYPDTSPALTTIGAGLTYDQPTRSGYRVYRFTGGTGTVTI